MKKVVDCYASSTVLCSHGILQGMYVVYISSTSLIIQLRFFQNFAFVIYISNIIDINTLLSPILQIIMVSDMLFMSTVDVLLQITFYRI